MHIFSLRHAPLLIICVFQIAEGLSWFGGVSNAASSKKQVRVAITGASGMLGTGLTERLRARDVQVVTIGRGVASDVKWDPDAESFPDWAALEGVDAVVHLAGENVGSGEGPLAFLGRWSPSKKQAILESRVKGTRLLVDAVSRLRSKPKVFISASGAGVYGYDDLASSPAKDESSPIGDGFLAYVCQQWEGEARKAERNAGMRVVVARLAVVLSLKGGVLAKLLPLFLMGGGGNLGAGTQAFSWVSLADAVSALEFALEESRVTGAVNVCSPAPVDNAAFTQALGQAVARPTIVPLPETAAGLLFGEMGREILLGGQKVVPAKLTKAGFRFQDTDIITAIANIVKNKL